MSQDTILVQTGWCRLCSQPISRDPRTGWYHDARDLGTARGVWPHFAKAVQA